MTDWDVRWQQGETPWDKGEAAPPLLEFLDGPDGELLKQGRVAVPGCGSGHDVRALAANGATVVGLDLSPKAIQVAESFPVAGSEVYQVVDILSDPPHGFDAAWEHTCFCAIHPSDRSNYARALSKIIRSGGRLAGVFYLTPQDRGEAHEGPPYPSKIDEIIRHLEPWFTLCWGRVPRQAFPSREGREWLALFERNAAQPQGCEEST